MMKALGQDPQTRQAAYRELFRHELEPGKAGRPKKPPETQSGELF